MILGILILSSTENTAGSKEKASFGRFLLSWECIRKRALPKLTLTMVLWRNQTTTLSISPPQHKICALGDCTSYLQCFVQSLQFLFYVLLCNVSGPFVQLNSLFQSHLVCFEGKGQADELLLKTWRNTVIVCGAILFWDWLNVCVSCVLHFYSNFVKINDAIRMFTGHRHNFNSIPAWNDCPAEQWFRLLRCSVAHASETPKLLSLVLPWNSERVWERETFQNISPYLNVCFRHLLGTEKGKQDKCQHNLTRNALLIQAAKKAHFFIVEKHTEFLFWKSWYVGFSFGACFWLLTCAN